MAVFTFSLNTCNFQSCLLQWDWPPCPVTHSSVFQTLMPSALLYPAGPYRVVHHLKSMYSCTLRSSTIRQDYLWFIEVMTSLHWHSHILLFVLHHFLSRPHWCLNETMLSSLLSAHSPVTDWCTGVNRKCYYNASFWLLQWSGYCVSPGQRRLRMRPRLSVRILMSID